MISSNALDRTAGIRPGESRIAVSVVVPVRNDRGGLRTLVEALQVQTLPRTRFEVVVADDGSTDGGASGLATETEWLRISAGPPINPYAARNRGASFARGPVLAFCDADCIPEPSWLEEGLQALEGQDLVAGIVRFMPPERPSTWALVDMETFLDQQQAVRGGRAMTANLFVRRDVFERVGAFDDSLANGGDQEFVARSVASGARLTFSPRAAVWHPPRATARSFLAKLWTVNRRYGVRRGRAGGRPERLTLKAWVPLVSTVRSRLRADRGLLLDRRRIGESGIRPTSWQDVRALPVIYLVVPYVANIAQAVGWCQGRLLRHEWSSSVSSP